MTTLDSGSNNPNGIGQQLRTAREAMHLTEKDAALRLHLHTEVIRSLENETPGPELPPVFFRGYLRAYARMLQLPESTIQLALQQFPLTDPLPTRVHTPVSDPSLPSANSAERFSRRIGYAMFAGVLGLVLVFIYTTHNDKTKNLPLAESSGNAVTTASEPAAPPSEVAPTPTTATAAPTPPTAETAADTTSGSTDATSTDATPKTTEKVASSTDASDTSDTVSAKPSEEKVKPKEATSATHSHKSDDASDDDEDN